MNAVRQDYLICCIGKRMYALGKHTVRTRVKPCTQFEYEIHCIAANEKESKHRLNNAHATIMRPFVSYTYITIAVITTRPDLLLSPGSIVTVLLWPISRR